MTLYVCPRCGSLVNEDDYSCQVCGRELSDGVNVGFKALSLEEKWERVKEVRECFGRELLKMFYNEWREMREDDGNGLATSPIYSERGRG